jgi:hypothetical protein
MTNEHCADVVIDEISVRLPSIGDDRARALGEQIALLVGQDLAHLAVPIDLGAVKLRVALATSDVTAERVAAAVTRAAARTQFGPMSTGAPNA